MICLSLESKTLMENLADVEKYRRYIDLCELRADYLEEWTPEAIRQFPLRAGVPIIFTLRRVADGGHWKGTEEQRCRKICEVLSSHYSWLDLESNAPTGTATDCARRQGVRIIRSVHESGGVPDDLPRIIQELPQEKEEIPRVVTTPRSVADLRRLLAAMRMTSGHRIIQGMGEWGFAGRILSAYFGCWCTLVSPENTEHDPVPLSPEILAELYRYRSVSPSTSVYGIIGNPVLHSRSPRIHNSGYNKQSLNAVYLPFQVDDLQEFMLLAEELGIKGLSVTIPHKSAVIPFLDQSSKEVEAIGACNTLVRTERGFEGHNTDVSGFLSPLKSLCGKSVFPGRAVVIGAGGAARAVIYGLKQAGTEVLIVNRTESKAAALAAEFGCRGASLSPEIFPEMAEYGDLIVQTSAAGMHPLEDTNPVEGYPWRGSEIAYDLVYVPETTRFLAAAKQAGCRTINGSPMLQAQAEAQYLLFTGMNYPAQ
ncbi:shikimate dehydrogenase [Marispirochaeta sp.]|jgi:3-dehydroquinate dehydratase / shikimate dehydrogenase|uniref:shikimate dehydrogenase n=1 Tax=Marispirochaeta sp. TaxID=2038653 RepID=UPI0029C706E1|nr:shikimate dehydrogenase [Marispirochaeta sp.]